MQQNLKGSDIKIQHFLKPFLRHYFQTHKFDAFKTFEDHARTLNTAETFEQACFCFIKINDISAAQTIIS